MKQESEVLCALLGHAAELEFEVFVPFRGDGGHGGHEWDYEDAQKCLKDGTAWGKSKAFGSAHGWVSKKNWKPEFTRLIRKARRLAKKHRAYIESVGMLLLNEHRVEGDQIPPLEKNE